MLNSLDCYISNLRKEKKGYVIHCCTLLYFLKHLAFGRMMKAKIKWQGTSLVLTKSTLFSFVTVSLVLLINLTGMKLAGIQNGAQYLICTMVANRLKKYVPHLMDIRTANYSLLFTR